MLQTFSCFISLFLIFANLSKTYSNEFKMQNDLASVSYDDLDIHPNPITKSICKQSSGDVPDSNYAMETLEGGPSSIVAGCVNAITGDFFDTHVSMTIPGAQPLSVQCTYCSSENEWNFAHMPSLEVGYSKGGNHVYARYLDDNGSGITYRNYTKKQDVKNYTLTIPEALFKKGLTNCGSGMICGKTNLRNSNILWGDKKEKVYQLQYGSGIKRTFWQSEYTSMAYQGGEVPSGKFYLKDEIHPNGNRLQYDYNDELYRVRAVNQLGQLLSSLKIKKDWGSKIVQWVSDCQSSTFYFEDKMRNKLIKISPSHAVGATYRYNKKGVIDKKEFPEGRFLQVVYHDSGKQQGRVYQLKTAAGLAYTFKYNIEDLSLIHI